MARSRPKEVSIFNFAFLDIVAATIGVLIFVMVLVLVNSTNRVSAKGLEEEVSRINQEAAKEKKKGEEWQQRAQEERKRQEHLQQGQGAAKKELDDAQKRHHELTGALKDAETQRAAAAAQAADARRKLEEDKKQPQPKAPPRQQVGFRVPRLRETTKEPVLFEFDAGRIYLFAFERELNKSNYSGISLGGAALINRNSHAHGETLAEALQRSSSFYKTLQRTLTTKHYLIFFVRANSFTMYRTLRETLWKWGYDLNWSAYENDEQIIVGTGGGGGRGESQ